jgi:hypothetical protein
MPGLRKEAQEDILKWIDEIDTSGYNRKIYEHKFSAMNDAEFDVMITAIEQGRADLAIIAPNFSQVKLSVANNFRVGDLLGHKFFQKINVPAKDGKPAYQTPIPYLVMDLPARRQAQLLEKKISIPEHNNAVDDLTGQPTGPSKGSRLSYPEIQVLAALGFESSVVEMLKYRGGDEKGFNAMNTMIARTGGVSQKAIEPYSGGVKATQTLKSYLAGMHLKATL